MECIADHNPLLGHRTTGTNTNEIPNHRYLIERGNVYQYKFAGFDTGIGIQYWYNVAIRRRHKKKDIRAHTREHS